MASEGNAHVDNIVFSIKHFNPFSFADWDADWNECVYLRAKISNLTIHTMKSFISRLISVFYVAGITTALIFYREVG